MQTTKTVIGIFRIQNLNAILVIYLVLLPQFSCPLFYDLRIYITNNFLGTQNQNKYRKPNCNPMLLNDWA